jgi:hypothetical protein
MLVLSDHGTPRSIARWLQSHTVIEAIERGWDKLSNGALLKAAEEAGFDLLLSTDKNIQYQQNLKRSPHCHCDSLATRNGQQCTVILTGLSRQ